MKDVGFLRYIYNYVHRNGLILPSQCFDKAILKPIDDLILITYTVSFDLRFFEVARK